MPNPTNLEKKNCNGKNSTSSVDTMNKYSKGHGKHATFNEQRTSEGTDTVHEILKR